MRALHKKSRSYIFILLAVLLFSAAILAVAPSLSTFVSAETVIYLEADVTLGGEKLPSTILYKGSAYSFDFLLYQSADASVWTKDTDATRRSNFLLKYLDADRHSINSAPSAPGTYYVRVVAEDTMNGYKNTAVTPLVISHGVVIGESKFTIVNENLSLFSSALDGVSSLVLDDTHSDYYSAVTSGAKVLLEGQALTSGSQYTLAVEFYNRGSSSFVATGTCSDVGTYRLVAKIASGVDLSKTVASVLGVDGSGNRLLYREFTVTRASLSLALTVDSTYVDRALPVTLTDESKTKLVSVGSYETKVIAPSTAGGNSSVERVLSSGNGAISYTPTAEGSYVYRVTFTSPSASYGIETGDFVDYPFIVKPVPYSVSYRINNDETDLLDYVIMDTAGGTKQLSPYFYDRAGNALTSVYTAGGARKYTIAYKSFNTALDSWQDLGSGVYPSGAGRYRVLVTFTAYARVTSDYNIETETVITKEFQIITSGTLSVTAANGGVNYYTGSGVVPSLLFFSGAMDVRSTVEGAYSLSYYAADGSSIGASSPSAVGSYFFELTFNSAIPSLGVSVGDRYRGPYEVRYRGLSVTNEDGAFSFSDQISGEARALTLGSDYNVSYYQKTGATYRLLPSAPSEQGEYLVVATFAVGIPVYDVKVGDKAVFERTIAGSTAWGNIATASIGLTYDTGVKDPILSFYNGASPLELQELTEYQVSYFKYDSGSGQYLPCGRAVLAGDYRCLVTFLKSDNAKGLVRGVYASSYFTVTPKDINVTYTLKESSADLVFDGVNKEYSVLLSADTRPLDLAFAREYAPKSDTPVYRAAPYAAAGDYYVRTTLSDDRSGSLNLVGARYLFTVQKLSVDVRFTVPLSYRAMYNGSAVTPSLTFKALNGRHAEAGYKTESAFSSLGIALSISNAYYSSTDGMNYLTPASPIKTGAYRDEISTGNASVELTTTTSIGDDETTVTPSYMWGEQANVIYSVIPSEIKTQVTFDADLYYTTAQKGVSSVAFYAYNFSTSSYSLNVTASFTNDYQIRYFTSDYKGTVSGAWSLTKPTEKSYYVARIVMLPNGTSDEYLTEERYTFMNGKTVLGADMDGDAIEEGSYVDFIFRIKDQTKIDVLFDMPVTFAFDGAAKPIGASFVNNFSTVDFIAGDDYAISYIPEGGAETSTAPSAVGNYRVKLKFLKNNTAYRIEAYQGEYTPQNALYISANDAIEYAFEIFAPRLMTARLNAPASLYYDGTAKTFAPSFTVVVDDRECLVMLTNDTHYRVAYYELSDGVYRSIEGAPTLPGSYAVEIVFLKNLYDYKIQANAVEVQLLLSNLTTLTQSNGVFASASTPRVAFNVNKAILHVGGLSVKDKEFDGTTAAEFVGLPALSVKEQDGVPLGALVKENGVFPYTFVGSMAGVFDKRIPGENVAINVSSYYALSEGASDLYELEFDVFKANIFKSSVTITPVDITRDYNPFAVESVIDYEAAYDQATFASVFPTFDASKFLIGELTREKGSTVGWYPIAIGTLALNDVPAGTVTLDGQNLKLSDLFEIKLVTAGYRIRERMVTIAVKEGQYKLYGEADPVILAEVVEGTLIYNDVIVGSPKREAGENAGTYRVSLSSVTIKNGAGDDVSANYHISLRVGTFEVRKRRITISPIDQTAPYLTGFDKRAINVLDRDHSNRNVTADFVTKPGAGDRLTGNLASEPTEDPLVFKITMGTLIVTNAVGKNVTSNYDILFNENAKYTVEQVDIVVRMAANAVLTKYYGDANPIIAFTIEKIEKDKLGSLTLSQASSIGRVAGEDAGTYRVYVDNTAHSFIVTDSGVDVSAYFNFNVRGVTFGDTMFTILPRPITVTVENATFENTGRDVIPNLKYLNANGTRLSSTVLSTLKVQYGIPDMKFDDGENKVTPIVVGEVADDPNFAITVTPGIITMIYLQNVVTATLVPQSDEIYKKHKFILAGIMLYKSARFYKLDTANGEQPDRKVNISLPLDSTLRGDGFVAVALYSSRNPRACSLSQTGSMLIYKDNGAYYVAVAQAEEWFYIIWGVVCILAGVFIYYTIVIVKKIVEKQKQKKRGANARTPKGSSSGRRAGFVSVAQPRPYGDFASASAAEAEDDDLFSDSNIAPEEDLTEGTSEEEDDIMENTDDLFASSASDIEAEGEAEAEEAPAEKAKPKRKGVALFAPSSLTDKKRKSKDKDEESETEESASTDDLFAADSDSAFAESATEAAEEASATEEKKPEEKKGKEKKGKEKKEKAPKKGKDDKKGKGGKNEPKGFRPMAFTPSGAKSSAYAPTRSYEDDLFFDDDLDIKSEGAAITPYNENSLSDDGISIPASPSSAPEKPSSDDDLVLAKSSNFFGDDLDDDKKDSDDPDMI